MSGGIKTIFKSALSVSSTAVSDLGTIGEVRQDTAGNQYRLVKMAASAIYGHIMVYDSLSGNSYIVSRNDQTVVRGAGVYNQISSPTSIAAAAYCWIQQHGIGLCSMSASYAARLNLVMTTGGAAITNVASDDGPRLMGHTIQSVTTGNGTIRIMMGP